MIRSNSKAALTAIREHINDVLVDYCADICYDEPKDEWPKSYHERCKCYLNDVIRAHGHLLECRQVQTYQELLTYDFFTCNCFWFEPSVLRKYLQEWLQETDEEADKYSNTEVEERYAYLIAREVLKGANDPTKAMLKKD